MLAADNMQSLLQVSCLPQKWKIATRLAHYAFANQNLALKLQALGLSLGRSSQHHLAPYAACSPRSVVCETALPFLAAAGLAAALTLVLSQAVLTLSAEIT